MYYGGTYKGVRKYTRKKSKIKNEKYILKIVFLISLIATSIISLNKFSNKFNTKIILKDNIILKYIDITDMLSLEGYQINWQEVASINIGINKGNLEVFNEEDIKKIGSAFLKRDENGNVITLRSFKEAMKELKLNIEEESLSLKTLVSIEDNYLHTGLKNDITKKEFIKEVADVAYENYEEYKILPSITIAQAILESGWGESSLATDYNNYFGIKADSRWNGEKIEIKTKENYDDEVVAAFRAYSSLKDSIRDQGKFLFENERYEKSGLFTGKTYVEQAQALENAGYSTAKDEEGNLIYADKLVRVIKENNLMLYDTIAKR